jgi:predicted glutamine amidotransferase
MCGIIAAFQKKELGSVNDIIVNIYEDQHQRGKEGFGVVGVDGNMKTHIMRATEPVKFMFDLHKKEYNMIMAHHRMPTSTPNKLSQTHPIFVSNELLPSDFLVIHNGVISNSLKLNEEHTKMGFKYTTEFQQSEKWIKWNDSEVIAIELAMFISKKTSMIKAEGSAALVALELEKETGKLIQVHFGRNETNPLKLAASRGKIILSSEGPGSDVKPFMLYSFSPKGDMKLSSRSMTFHKEPYKSHYPAYSPKPTSPPGVGQSFLASGSNFKKDDWTWDASSNTWKAKSESANHELEKEHKIIKGFEPKQPITEEEADKMEQDAADEFQAFYQEVEIELEDFYATIADPSTCEFADIEGPLAQIRKHMERAKKGFIKFYEAEAMQQMMTDSDEYPLSLPAAHHG